MIKTLYPNTEIVYFSKLLWKKYIKQPNISMYIEIDHKLVPRKIFDINDRTSLPTEEPEIDSDKELDFDEDSFGPRRFGFDRSRRNNSNETRRMNVNKEEVQKGDFNSALMYFMKQKEREGGKWIFIYGNTGCGVFKRGVQN